MNDLTNINRYFRVIDRSLFRIDGTLDYDRLTDAIIKLSNAVHDYPDETESLWSIGENDACTLADLIVGAYWHFAEWHGGQWSKGYAALSALGQIFQPGMSDVEPENAAYQALDVMARHA